MKFTATNITYFLILHKTNWNCFEDYSCIFPKKLMVCFRAPSKARILNADFQDSNSIRLKD